MGAAHPFYRRALFTSAPRHQIHGAVVAGGRGLVGGLAHSEFPDVCGLPHCDGSRNEQGFLDQSPALDAGYNSSLGDGAAVHRFPAGNRFFLGLRRDEAGSRARRAHESFHRQSARTSMVSVTAPDSTPRVTVMMTDENPT